MSSPSSVRKNKPSKEQSISRLASYVHAGLLLGLFVDPEDGGDIFHRNVD
jgi:hypothetical protein